MKKSLLVIAICFFAVFAVVFMTGGSYTADTLNNVNKIKSNSTGITIESKGPITLDAVGALTFKGDGALIMGDTSGNTVTQVVSYVMLSPTATGGGIFRANKIYFGETTIVGDAQNVTLTAGNVFTGATTYAVYATYYHTAEMAAAVAINKVSGSVFTIAGEEQKVMWMAVGY